GSPDWPVLLTVYVSPNSGAAFGFAPAATVVFTCPGGDRRADRHQGAPAALGRLGGSTRPAAVAGNLCDRLMRAPGIGRGAVVDFIDLQHFADFNIADSCLTCGAVLAVLLSPRGIPMTDQSPDHAERQDMGDR